ncbi:hypothetical protein SAMN02745857_03792 [Andreprevotia lacus DSM 23236]|jgi:hypothetical protein|uniref:Uncharacterized protein n=1 Tax=Andreprevotia lacus DSM 23236 TaxID=1121001 RepID=A0A1W1XZQ8_9NEIS|nr:hypothetical protein [Andreprevotia lacus]SMC29372.1 hypothetical protein SAMN02745857_03792 [Andreprevotia lacus DSM 23236]
MGLSDKQAKWVLYGAGALALYLYLRGVRGVAADVGKVALDVAQATGTALYETGKAAGSDWLAKTRTVAEIQWLQSVRGLTGVSPGGPVEESILMSYMPSTATVQLDAVPGVGLYVAVRANLAGSAVHQYRQAVGIEPKPAPGFFQKLFSSDSKPANPYPTGDDLGFGIGP